MEDIFPSNLGHLMLLQRTDFFQEERISLSLLSNGHLIYCHLQIEDQFLLKKVEKSKEKRNTTTVTLQIFLRAKQSSFC